MSELSYKALPELLDEIKSGKICSVYLLYGDEFIYRSAFKSVLEVLVPPSHQDLNYEAVDGENENVYEPQPKVAQRMKKELTRMLRLFENRPFGEFTD